MRLLGESENRPRGDSYGHSAAFINSVSRNLWKRRFEENLSRIQQVRAYQSPAHIRKLMDYTPGISCNNLRQTPSDGKLICDIQTPNFAIADSHRNSNFYNPVLTRIGLGK